MKPNILSATTITGSDVKNLERENIGNIQDLMIELESGNVAYAVLSFGGFLGIGDKYFAIPIEALQFSAKDNDDTIILDIKKEQLENAPGFDKDNWPLTADQDFIDSVYDHYGYERRRASQI